MDNTISDDAFHYNGVDYLPATEVDRCDGCAFTSKDGCKLLNDPGIESTRCSPGTRADDRGIIWVRANTDKAAPTPTQAPTPLPTIQQLWDACEIIFRRRDEVERIALDMEVIQRYGLDMLRLKFEGFEYLLPMSAQAIEYTGDGYYLVIAYTAADSGRPVELGFFNCTPVKV